MKRPLSELIREGARIRPQAFGCYIEQGRSCAIGAAAEAAGATMRDYSGCLAVDGTWLMENIPMHVQEAIYDLNDTEGRSREYIADWLAESGLDVLVPVMLIPVEKILPIQERALVSVG